jgi:hypothetical protein
MEKVAGLSERPSNIVFPQRNFVVILLSVPLDAVVILSHSLIGA